MTWWERWGFNTLHTVVAVTGIVYFYMKYAMVTDDPFAVVNHPWQSMMLALHIVLAPFFVAFFGMLFRSHSFRKIMSSDPKNRRTGWTSLVSFSLMALSGYLIQVVTSSVLITVMIWAHVATSTLFLVGYGIHLVLGYRVTTGSPGTTDSSLAGPARLSL